MPLVGARVRGQVLQHASPLLLKALLVSFPLATFPGPFWLSDPELSIGRSSCQELGSGSISVTVVLAATDCLFFELKNIGFAI